MSSRGWPFTCGVYLSPVLALGICIGSIEARAEADAANPEVSGVVLGQSDSLNTGVLLAQDEPVKKKKRRRPAKGKKKAVEGDAAAVTPVDGEAPVTDAAAGTAAGTDTATESAPATGGGWLHSRQEGGKDMPYRAELGLGGGLSYSSAVASTDGEAGDPATTLTINPNLRYLFIMGNMAIGPEVSVSNASTTQKSAVPDGGDIKTSTTALSLAAVGKYNIGRIDRDTMVPYVEMGIGFVYSSTKAGDSDAMTQTGFGVKPAAGIQYFLDSNVAMNIGAQFGYNVMSSKTDVPTGTETIEVEVKYTTTNFGLVLGISTFI